jgi:phage nucleotide-binding protein
MDIKNRIVSPSELVDNQGAKILVYGEAGSGKTTLCSTAPGKILMISAEAGLLSIKDSKNVDAIEVKEAHEVMEIHDQLKSGALKYDTVCLDSISEISEVMLEAELARHKDPRKAYGLVKSSVVNVMRSYRDLHMHVLFLAKMSKQNVDNTMIYEPLMVGTKLGQEIMYLFDEVLVLRVAEEQGENDEPVYTRWLQTSTHDGFTAKDRSGKLETYEPTNATDIIAKLGFSDNSLNVVEQSDNEQEVQSV